jgi:hydrogenase maturation protease
MTEGTLLILGIGNLLLQDEGVGVHALARLETEALPGWVQLLDGGTGGFHLLGHLGEHRRVILIDATLDGQPAGTVSVLRPRFAEEFPRSLSAHDIGLRDLIETATLLGQLPEITLITVSVQPDQPMHVGLSPSVAGVLEQIVMEVRRLLDELELAAPEAPRAGAVRP